MNTPTIVAPEEWKAAREKLLVKEKEHTRSRDALAAERRRMPWMAVEKEYGFEGPDGSVSLTDMFEGRRQLIVYRAFYGPEVTTYAEGGSYPQRACVGCSFVADQVSNLAHLNARDTTLAFASRAPQAEIQRPEAAERMGAHPLVHDHRRLRQGFRRRRVARAQRVHPRGRPDLPHVLHRRPRRRGHGHHLELSRSDRSRPPGGVGGLAGGLAADAALPVVELQRRVRHVIAHISGVPAEELVPALSGAGAGLLVVRGWIMLRLRRRRKAR